MSGEPTPEVCVNFSHTRDAAADRKVADVMVRNPKWLSADATVGAVREKFTNASLRNVLLLDDGTLAGIVDRDSLPADAPDTAPAASVASVNVPTVTATTSVADVLSMMDADHSDRRVGSPKTTAP